MMRYPIPTQPGFYWAKWRICDDHTDDIEDFKPHTRWEVVDVFENHNCDDEDDQLRVHVTGVRQSQHLDNFVWGLPVFLPQVLVDSENESEKTWIKPPLPHGIPDTPEVRATLQEFVSRGNNAKTREAIINKLLVFISAQAKETES
jgi:hypothetical protein